MIEWFTTVYIILRFTPFLMSSKIEDKSLLPNPFDTKIHPMIPNEGILQEKTEYSTDKKKKFPLLLSGFLSQYFIRDSTKLIIRGSFLLI